MDNNRPVPPPPPEETYHRRRRRGAILFRRALFRIILLAIVALFIILGWNIIREKAFDAKGFISHDTGLTDKVVMTKLQEIGQLATYSYEYKGVREIKDSKQLFGWNIPGTTHTIHLSYDGIIKVGYEVSDIQVSVDNENKIINVRLPEPKVTDNSIALNADSYDQQNNILNPINGDEPIAELDTIKAEELEKAENAGIYELAKGNAKKLISGLLAGFDGYNVKFVD